MAFEEWQLLNLAGKYSFAVLIGTSKIIWSFGLGAGVVFGCQNETYRRAISHAWCIVKTPDKQTLG